VQATGSFVPAFLVGAIIALCAGVGYFIIVRDLIPPMARAAE
jgi:hypothetical protein